MAGRFSVEAVFKAVDRITAPVSRMQKRVGKFTRSMERGLRGVNRAMKATVSGLKKGAVVGAAAFAALSLAMRDVIMTGADFGRAIGSAAAKFPDKIKRGTKEFRALEAAARAVGSTTEFTSTQAARGLNFLAKAGFGARVAMETLPDIVDFATASEMELAEASDIASDALGAFGLNSKNAEKKLAGLRRVMDVMSLTANSTTTSVAELFESVRGGAPVFAATGATIESFAATMGFLAGTGIKATVAGTAAKNITLALAGAAFEAKSTFRALRIETKDANGDFRDQFDVLDELREKLGAFGKVKQLGILKAIFGKISLPSAINLLSEAGKSVRGLRREFEAAGGSSKRTAAFIRDDVKGSIDGLISAIEGVKISIFSMNEGPLRETIDRMTQWVRANEDLIATNIGEFVANIADNFGDLVSKAVLILKITTGVLGLALALKAVSVAIAAVNLLMALNPIGLMILGFAALVGLAVLIGSKWDTISASIGGVVDKMRDFFGLGSGATQAVTGLGRLLGLQGGEGPAMGFGPSVTGLQERVAHSIEEQRTTSTSEVRLTAGAGTSAEVTRGKLGGGVTLQPSGAFP